METILIIEISFLLVIALAIIALIVRVLPSKPQFKEILDREKNILEVIEELINRRQDLSSEEIKSYYEQWAALANLLENQIQKEESTKITVNTPEGIRVITDINPNIRLRAQAVETIESMFKDSRLAPEMLMPFLNDPNNRVRATAAKAISQYNPQLSLDTLLQMCKHTDKWMRISAAWALGELGTAESGEMMQLLLDDPDTDVKNKARQSMQKILNKSIPENS